MVALLTIGTFDLFHAGHVELLASCAAIADHVTVGINTDSFVSSYKGTPPILTLAERTAVVSSCCYVDYIVANDGQDAKPTISAWLSYPSAPAYYTEDTTFLLAVGKDWKDKDYLAQLQVTEDFLRQNNITLVYIHTTNELHSTEIKRRCTRPVSPLH